MLKKSAIFLRKVLYFDQTCYKSAIINPKSAIKALYFMGTSAINYSTFAIFFFWKSENSVTWQTSKLTYFKHFDQYF